MTLFRHDWSAINIGGDDVTYEHLCLAIIFMGEAIDSLDVLEDDVGVYLLTIEHLTGRLNRLIKLKADRIPDRPELGTRVVLNFEGDSLAFRGLPGGSWGLPASEKTKRLSELIREVYEETKSVKEYL